MSSDKLSETDLIRRLFVPLSQDYEGALGLNDDAALIQDRPGHEIVVTTDCLVEGVHFLPNDPPAAVAARALRTNLSDLAAMGASPHAYTMAISIPDHIDFAWLEQFAAQLGKDQKAYNICLIGGDTVATPGPLSIAVTALGHVPAGMALRRSGAQPGDNVYVTGTIGDASLGLKVILGDLVISDEQAQVHLVDRFHFPTARTDAGQIIRQYATACADISDGLIRDLGNICTASACRALIEWERIPLSAAATRVLEDNASFLDLVLTGGDDYELVFTCPRDLSKDFTRIGVIEATGNSDFTVEVRKNGTKLDGLNNAGYQHRW